MQRPLPHRSLLIGLLSTLLTLPAIAADAEQHVRCGFLVGTERERVTKLGEGILAQRPRPVLPEFVDSPDRIFRVHFTRSGPDAVPNEDRDGNGTPDYVDEAIDALLSSWAIQQDFGAPPQPPSDGTAGGSPAFDVYLRDLATEGSAGTGLYGITVPDSLLGKTSEWPTFSSWMEVDNDFSPADTNIHGDTVFATFGVDGLRVTCAHELHHVAQLGEVGDAGVQLMLYEMMSTYMEIACYPEISDWAVYAAKFFRTPAAYAFGDPGSVNGYVWGWFFRAWAGAAMDLYTGIFASMQDGARPFSAMVSASSALGVGRQLDSLFVRSLPDMYHTGSRGADNTVILRAHALPEITWQVNETAVPPSTMATGTHWGVRLQPSSVAAWIDNVATRRPDAPYPQPVRVTSSTDLFVPIADAFPGDEATITLMTVQTLGITTATAVVTLDGDRIVVPFSIPGDLTPGTYLLQAECNGRTDLHKLAVRR